MLYTKGFGPWRVLTNFTDNKLVFHIKAIDIQTQAKVGHLQKELSQSKYTARRTRFLKEFFQVG